MLMDLEKQYKIFNLGIPISFSGLRQDGKWPVLNGRELDGTGSGWSQVLETENFLDFFEKNPVPEKWYLGTQTSKIIKLVWINLYFI